MWKVLPNVKHIDRIWLLFRNNKWHCYLRYVPVGRIGWHVPERPVAELATLELAKEFCHEQWPGRQPTIRHDGLFQNPVAPGMYSFGAFLGDLKYRQ